LASGQGEASWRISESNSVVSHAFARKKANGWGTEQFYQPLTPDPKPLLLVQQRPERGRHCFGKDFGAFGGGVDAVLLNGVGDVDQVLVNHGHEGGVVFGCHIDEHLLEGVDVIGTIIRREGDAGQQDFDVRVFEGGQNGIEILPRLGGGQATEAVVPAELDDDDFGVRAQYGWETGDGVLGGGAAGALVEDFVVVTVTLELSLEKVGIGLAGLESVPGGDAVAEADDDGAVGGERGGGENKGQERNDKSAANVHIRSVGEVHGRGTRD